MKNKLYYLFLTVCVVIIGFTGYKIGRYYWRHSLPVATYENISANATEITDGNLIKLANARRWHVYKSDAKLQYTQGVLRGMAFTDLKEIYIMDESRLAHEIAHCLFCEYGEPEEIEYLMKHQSDYIENELYQKDSKTEVVACAFQKYYDGKADAHANEIMENWLSDIR